MTTESTSPRPEQLALLRSLSALLAARRFIVGSGLVAAALMGVTLLVLPRTYTSTISIQPQSRRMGGNFAGLAAQIGVSLPGTDAAQPPAFFADLAQSPTILRPVVEHDYGDSVAGARSLVMYYAIDEERPALRQHRAVEKLLGDLHVSLNARTGVLRLSVTMEDPALAKAVVQRLVDELDTYNQLVRQSQAGAERRFSEARVDEGLRELRLAEDRMRTFLKLNRGPRVSPDLKFEEEGLLREISVRQTVYTTLTQMYEQARLEEVRDTPVLNVVEPATEAPAPDRRGIVFKSLVALIVGFGAALVLVLIRAGLVLDPESDVQARYLALSAATSDDIRRIRAVLTFRRP